MFLKSLLLITSLLFAAAEPQVAGIWVEDEALSDDMEPVMAAAGMPWPIRKLVGAGTVVAHIELQKEGEATIEIDVGLVSKSRKLVMDKKERVVDHDWGEQREIHYWDDEGALITETVKKYDDGLVKKTSTIRKLESPDRLKITTIVEASGKAPVQGSQVYDRQAKK